VEAVFSGPAEAVEDMVGRCATGPRLARVEAVERALETAAPSLRFEQLPTL
jgi:acylphosphatase